MKLAIIGTRGIPNRYGGFEQISEYLSAGLAARGYEVSVYCSSDHPYKKNQWQGIELIHCYDAEKYFPTAGQFLYDWNCIRDARKRNFDVLLFMGYTSSSIWGKWFPEKSLVISNMDGLEWKRSKYSKPVQQFLMRAERWAVKSSTRLIADSKGIQQYLLKKYNKHSDFVAYGATLFDNPDQSVPAKYEVIQFDYNLIIARMEPENNLEVILQGYQKSNTTEPLLLIGNY